MTTTINFFECTIEWFDDGLETTVIMTETDEILPNDDDIFMYGVSEQLLEENDFPDFRVISWEKYSREETFENN